MSEKDITTKCSNVDGSTHSTAKETSTCQSTSGKSNVKEEKPAHLAFQSSSFTQWRKNDTKSKPPDVNILKNLLLQKQKTLNSVNPRILPDGGQRLIEQIKNLKLEIAEKEENQKSETTIERSESLAKPPSVTIVSARPSTASISENVFAKSGNEKGTIVSTRPPITSTSENISTKSGKEKATIIWARPTNTSNTENILAKSGNDKPPVVWARPPTASNSENILAKSGNETSTASVQNPVVWAGPPECSEVAHQPISKTSLPAQSNSDSKTSLLKTTLLNEDQNCCGSSKSYSRMVACGSKTKSEVRNAEIAAATGQRMCKETSPHTLEGYNNLWSDGSLQQLFYGGRMTNSRVAQVRTVTEDTIIKLHESLDGCPGPEVHALNPSNLSASLMPHQRGALAWLLWREKQDPPGGVLADDMGLGKTLTLIALVLNKKQDHGTSEEVAQQQEGWLSKKGLAKSGGTLVVCPASLLLQWEKEVRVHCKADSLNVRIYHGPNRQRDFMKLSSYDMVLTTYSILTNEIGNWKEATDDTDYSKAPTLLRVVWERVVLDEAHTIKNHKSKSCHAVCLLRATYRWALTGTPIHNDLMDMYALLRFLRVTPFDELKVWKKWVDNKTSQGKERLSTLIKCLLLRRTKEQLDSSGKPLVRLPTKTSVTHEIALSAKEREVYDRIYKLFQSALSNILLKKADNKPGSDKAGGQRNQAILFTLLLRLQQACNHLSLLVQGVKESEETDADDLANQLQTLQIEGQSQKVENDEDTLGLAKHKEDKDFDKTSESVKVSSLLKELKAVIKMQDKCVIVSQWTSMLKIVGERLRCLDIPYALIQGDVSVKQRMAHVDNFNDHSHKLQVMLLSLKAGGVGLNLTGGNHLFLLDIHWNPALEQQACDRIFRVGQTKNVTIHRFICKDTVEEKIAQLQAVKLELARSILSKENASAHLTLNDLKDMFYV